MKIAVPPSRSGSQAPPDLSRQTYTEAKAAREGTKAILDLLEAPPESEQDDPLALLMEQLVKIEARLMRIVARLGIDDSESSQQPD